MQSFSSSKVSTLVRILLAGSEGKTASAAWLDADQDGRGGFGGLSRQERFELDCEYRAFLRKHLKERHWDALIARYTIEPADRAPAIKRLARIIATPAHDHFKSYAVLAWAMPQRAGVEGKRSTIVLRENIYDMARWDNNQGTSERTMRRWRGYIHEMLNEALDLAIAAAIHLLEGQELFEREVA
jgi:hypothetical protein